MIKIAIFIEGLTERTFIRKLIGQRYGGRAYRLVESTRRKWEYLSLPPIRSSPGLVCQFTIVEMPSYDNLFSYVIENAATMVNREGYNLLIGLRDLHPGKRVEKNKIINLHNRMLANQPERDKIALLLAVMQTEAWFLSDHGMFSRINSALTTSEIKARLSIDLINDDPELYDKPEK